MVKLDNILSDDIRSEFRTLLLEYDEVFDPQLVMYDGSFGHFEATINIGPTQLPQCKGKVPQILQR